MKIALARIIQCADLEPALVDDQQDGTVNVFFDAMTDGEVLGVQVNMSNQRATDLSLLVDGEPVDLAAKG